MKKKPSDKPFECDICHKRYSYRQSLRNHKRIHTDRNPYKCNIYAKAFYKSSSLKNHKRIHTGENACITEFNSCQSRMQHIKAHHDPKPYHCDKCDRKYKLNMDLDHHKRKHQIIKTRKLYQNDTLVKFM